MSAEVIILTIVMLNLSLITLFVFVISSFIWEDITTSFFNKPKLNKKGGKLCKS